jgi:hypothetical protein
MQCLLHTEARSQKLAVSTSALAVSTSALAVSLLHLPNPKTKVAHFEMNQKACSSTTCAARPTNHTMQPPTICMH